MDNHLDQDSEPAIGFPLRRGSRTNQTSSKAITTPPTAETMKVVSKPAMSAIQPPISGATIVAGATSVFDIPMYMGRVSSVPNSVVIAMPIVQ